MPKIKDVPRLESIMLELDQLGGVAEILADRITGNDIDGERTAFLLANRLKALSSELDGLELPDPSAPPPVQEAANS